MIKMSLMVEATAPTYGLSIWTDLQGAKPSLRWAEGFEEPKLLQVKSSLRKSLRLRAVHASLQPATIQSVFCLLFPSANREGAALYGRCVRPLTANQAKELNAIE